MKNITLLLVLSTTLCCVSCSSSTPIPVQDKFDPENPLGSYKNKFPTSAENYPGGNTTGPTVTKSDSFNKPIPILWSRLKGKFHAGNNIFDMNWTAPLTPPSSSPTLGIGLGPFYNRPACGACHTTDGRAEAPEFPFKKAPDARLKSKSYELCSNTGGQFGGMLFRISIPKKDPNHPSLLLSQADPVYGDQLEPFTTGMSKGEADQCLTWQVMTKADYEGQYVVKLKQKNGSTKTLELVRPIPKIKNWHYGPPAGSPVYISPRIGPQVIGMGLLEAIPIEQLKALADPGDRNNDGISGRLMIIPKFVDIDGKSHENVAGRFGWKAEQPTVSAQTAGAFLGDMGVTSPLHRENLCLGESPTANHKECLLVAKQSTATPPYPEIASDQYKLVVTYTSLLAVPPRNFEPSQTDQVIRGWRLFRSIGCDKCHNPSFTVEQSHLSPISETFVNREKQPLFHGQQIFPYTDLLVHDMGPGLCDDRPPFEPDAAGSCEWRTPPLWGVGRIPDVNGHNQLLHDGRATGVEEAILWHGGEAKKQKDYYTMLGEEDRDALVAYVNSL